MSNINILKLSKNSEFDNDFYKNDNNNKIVNKKYLNNSLITKVYKKNNDSPQSLPKKP